MRFFQLKLSLFFSHWLIKMIIPSVLWICDQFKFQSIFFSQIHTHPLTPLPGTSIHPSSPVHTHPLTPLPGILSNFPLPFHIPTQYISMISTYEFVKLSHIHPFNTLDRSQIFSLRHTYPLNSHLVGLNLPFWWG